MSLERHTEAPITICLPSAPTTSLTSAEQPKAIWRLCHPPCQWQSKTTKLLLLDSLLQEVCIESFKCWQVDHSRGSCARSRKTFPMQFLWTRFCEAANIGQACEDTHWWKTLQVICQKKLLNIIKLLQVWPMRWGFHPGWRSKETRPETQDQRGHPYRGGKATAWTGKKTLWVLW